MVYRGHVENGVVVFDEPAGLPDGTTVQIEPVEGHPRRSLAERLEGLIGAIDDLPSDMAEQHDHYIHGKPKK